MEKTRRGFFSQSLAALGAVGLASQARAAAHAQPKGFDGFAGVELGIATICVDGFSNQHHEAAFAGIADLGFKNVEFNLWYPDTVTPQYFQSLKRRCQQTGLNPVSVQGNGYGHCGRDGLVKDVAHKLLLIEGCRTLGCHIVKCTGARRGNEGGVDAVIGTLREIAPVAEERGVLLTLENHAKNVLERAEDYDRIFAAIDSPNVGMCLDTGHFEGVGVDVHEIINRFGDRILEVDLKDCREKGAGHNTVAFGEGVTDFDSILQHLMRIDYKGYLIIEQAWNKPPASWKEDLASAYKRFKKWERPE